MDAVPYCRMDDAWALAWVLFLIVILLIPTAFRSLPMWVVDKGQQRRSDTEHAREDAC